MQIQGLDRLMRKFENISNLSYSQIIDATAEKLSNELKSAASFSSHAGLISPCDVRQGENYKFIDVGLKNTSANWESWKQLYFHEYGYEQFFYGHDTHKRTTCHVQWFSGTINGSGDAIKADIKAKIKAEIKAKKG